MIKSSLRIPETMPSLTKYGHLATAPYISYHGRKELAELWIQTYVLHALDLLHTVGWSGTVRTATEPASHTHLSYYRQGPPGGVRVWISGRLNEGSQAFPKTHPSQKVLLQEC